MTPRLARLRFSICWRSGLQALIADDEPLAALQALEKTGSDAHVARMKNGERIPVSRSGYDKLRAVL